MEGALLEEAAAASLDIYRLLLAMIIDESISYMAAVTKLERRYGFYPPKIINTYTTLLSAYQILYDISLSGIMPHFTIGHIGRMCSNMKAW